VPLIAALASDAELLVLDEPTSGLDPLMEQAFQQCVREAVDAGATVLLSSHIMGEVEALADRVSIIRAGRTISSGTLADLRRHTTTDIHAVTDTHPRALQEIDGVENLRIADDGSGRVAGVPLLSRIAVRTGWPGAAVWVAGLVGLFSATALSMAALHDSPETLAAYGSSLGEAMVMLNGRVAGLDTFGGIVMNEFALIVSFSVPTMAIGLTARTTRRDEETGRTELLLAGRVGRLAPLAAALVVVAVTFAVLGAGLWASTLLVDADRIGAVLYAASITATGCVYAAGTAVLAQVVAHTRTLWAIALATAGVTLVTRGIGDVNENWLSWTSPLGWHGLVRPFGHPDVLPLIVSVAGRRGGPPGTWERLWGGPRGWWR